MLSRTAEAQKGEDSDALLRITSKGEDSDALLRSTSKGEGSDAAARVASCWARRTSCLSCLGYE